jgi:hypothetical protein
MRSPIVLTAAITALLAVAAPASADRGSWNGWHVHDGTAVPYTDAGGLTHRSVAIFPAIFTGGNVAAYIADPSLWAYCPNATDKPLLGDGVVDGSKSTAGVCMNEGTVIHLLSVPAGQSAPEGWSPIPGSSTGYYKLTARG